jgi:hypothetical protein
MKKIPLLIVVSLTHLIVSAQYQTKPLSLKDYIQVTLQDETAPQSMADKFSSVDVIDARDDSSEIGYCYSEGSYHYNGYNEKIFDKCYRIMPSAQESIETWAANYLHIQKQNTSENTLLIVIKKFWISPDATPVLFSYNKKGQPTDGFDAGVISKMEFYLKKDSIFFPLYRFDSVLAFTEKLPQYAGYLATETLKKSLEKLFTLNLDNINRKKIKLNFEEITSNNGKNAGLPILKDTIFKKGVYKNFEEFKMNSPSLNDYELRKGKLGDILYVKENGKEYPERKAWGFSDGTNIFINSADKYSKLIKRENTFYFAGIKGITRTTKHDLTRATVFTLATNSGVKYISYRKKTKYYTVDMETGEVY